MNKKLLGLVLVFVLGLSFFASQRPAQAWPWTTKVNIYGYARVGPIPCQYVDVYKGNQKIARVNCSWQGRWYVNGVDVNNDYRAIGYGGIFVGVRSREVSQRVNKPGGYAQDVRFPDINVPIG